MIQPGTQGLMFTGNEKVWPYREEIAPAPRGHKVPVPGDTEGTRIVMDLLREQCEKAGVEVRYETGVTNLVTDGDGDDRQVVGVGWRSFDTHGAVRARSVVLAAGGFVMNADMVARYTPALGSKSVHPRLDVRRRPGDPARPVGRRGTGAHGGAVHHRALLPAVLALQGDHRQPRRAALRGRGQATTRGRRTT
ncbi:hypothetical protein [Nocardioides convexus]|uniref:hypothetical protein n=1 Tax=Nocardioides convexus TaxID=2712224 RepID=UPI00241865E4|nr:hypothetical protein [Nocardioides convexus]